MQLIQQIFESLLCPVVGVELSRIKIKSLPSYSLQFRKEDRTQKIIAEYRIS